MTPTAITFAQLRNATVAKFNERVQLQQELIEIEALNAQNHSEIARRQVLCARARAGRRGHEDGTDAGGLNAGGDGVDESMVEGVHGPTRIGDVDGLKLGEEVAELQRAVELNLSLKKDVEQRLEENEVESTRIRKRIESSVTTEERRELMEMECRVGLLELEKLELERSRMLNEMVVRQKDSALNDARRQLLLRDQVIAGMKEAMEAMEKSCSCGAAVAHRVASNTDMVRLEQRMVPVDRIVGLRGPYVEEELY